MSLARPPSEVRFALVLPLAVLLCTPLLGCGGSTSSGPGVAAPSALAYATNPATYTKGAAIPPNAPQSTGGAVASYAVSPSLPAGLSLDSSTGVLSGTPAAPSPLTAYTVTAANAGGSASASLLLAVNDIAPSGLTYPNNPVTYTRGIAAAANVPTVSGGAVTRFTTSPALPAGLALDAATGAISGTPTAVAATGTYHLTASNSGGSSTFALTLTVNDAAPSGLTYSSNPAVYVSGASIPLNRPSSGGGAVVSYAVAPALPSGLSLDPVTGVIGGVPASPATSRSYTVTATNSGGAATVTLVIAVNAAPPTGLTYTSNAPIYTRGVTIPVDVPSSAGGPVASYAIAPPLPAGLALDPVSGVLSGTPTALSPAADYTVTASNTGGSATCVLTIAVREAAPAGLAYATNPTAYTIGVAIQPNIPGNGGGDITAYAVSPALPAGLVLDPHTGVISGTPTALTAKATYVVTGSNATGSAACDLVTAVVPSPIPPPATPVVTAGAWATAGQTALQASTQDQGTANGTAYLWTLANGTVTSGQGTRAITYSAGAPGPLTLSVKVSNLTGSATGSRSVAVVAVPVAQIFAQETVLAGSRARASVAAQANMTWQWTLGGSSAGVITSGAGNVVDYTAGLAAGAYQLSVTVQSPAGGSASASRTLHVVTGAFLQDARTSRQRYGHTVTTLADGRWLVAGGDELHASIVPTAELYDPYSNTWAPTGPMTAARAFHSASLLADGRVLVAGGADPSGAMLDTAELYDPATNGWSAAATMNATRQSHTATTLPDGTVLVTGGFGLDHGGTTGGYLASAEVYDPSGQAWFPVSPMASAHSQHTATLLQNGLVLVVAGAKASNTAGWLNTSELYDPAQQTWRSTGTLAKARTDHTATLLASGKVLVAGGRSTTAPIDDGELFDPSSGAWTKTANTMTVGHTKHAAALLPGGKVLVVGGSADASGGQVESYDPVSSRWTRVKDLLAGRTAPGAATLATGQVLAVGGRGVQPAPIASPELYDPASDAWTSGGSWSSSRFSHTTTVLAGGSLLVAGGSGDAAAYLDSAERFDPGTLAWTGAGKLASGRLDHTASLLSDGRVLVAGGLGTGSAALTSAELYSPSSNTWTTTGSLTAARYNHTATVLADGKVLVAGGSAGSATLASAELYDPATGLWSSAGAMAAARAGHTATLLAGGKVLVAGGGTSSTFLSSAELYDPAQNAWSPAAAMFSPRVNHTATLLPGGAVVMIGGQRDPNSGLATVERYDASANAWTALASLASGRYSHAATALPDGRLLVTGGRLTSFQINGTAELYDPVAQTTSALPLSAARAYHTATVIDAAGTVLVLGGSPGATPESWRP
jgi:hypothetical protein